MLSHRIFPQGTVRCASRQETVRAELRFSGRRIAVSGDLHCHTKLSDGSLGIEDLVMLAKKKGVPTIAITDHDCLAGTIRGKVIGDRYGVNVIPGAEFSSFDEQTGKQVHILCYLSEIPERLERLCHRNSLARKKATHYMMLQVIKRYPVTTEFILKCAAGSTNLYKQHIMKALMECGFTATIFGELYNSLFDEDRRGNILVTPKFPDIAEVVAAIHKADGVAVLAHPFFFDNLDSLPRLLEYGLDGIEVWHPSANAEQQKTLRKLAERHGLLMTGGTDFHGLFNKTPISVGDVDVPDEAIEMLLGYKAKLRRMQKRAQKAVAESVK